MNKIKVMDELLANKIAAGEVVEKMMNIVKELVENSIDANSTNITVILENSGIDKITVIDNGKGISKSDVRLAFLPHATSKIYEEDDLFSINTLGFRGEALAAISSVSKIEMITNDGKDSTKIILEGTKVIKEEDYPANLGTKITVSDIFYNTPARLKHIKNPYSELSYIANYFEKIVLSYPNIRFTLINDSKTLIATSGGGDILKVIHSIYGYDITKSMLPIQGENNDYSIKGYITKPEIHRSNKNGIITLVNNRVIRNYDLIKTINEAYHSYKPDNRYPVVVINITCDPHLIDVNIHPTKMDIKFSNFERLKFLISSLIKEAISNINLIPEVKEEINTELIVENKYEQQELDLSNPILKDNKIQDVILEENEKYEEKFPYLEYVGLLHGTYIIAQNNEGMYLIDQHAAKERVNYELVKENFKKRNKLSNSLIIPIIIELTPHEYLIFQKNSEELVKIGFSFDDMGINTIRFLKVPTWLMENEKEIIHELVTKLIIHEKDFDIERYKDEAAHDIACKMSIKANTYIAKEEAESLIQELGNCKNPFNCPHGRPTIIKYTKYEIERSFKRTGF